MKRARMLALMGLTSSAALCASSCVSLIGIDDDKKSAVDAYCSCNELAPGIYDTKAICVSEIDHALKTATEQTRAAWLTEFEKTCVHCSQWANCFRLAPTCTGAGPCLSSDCLDCCGPGLQAGTCGEAGA